MGVRPGDRRDPSASPDAGTEGRWSRLKRSADVLTAAGLAVVAAAAAALLPAGTPRLVVTLTILAFAPGYLLLQALLVPARSLAQRGRHLLLSLGLSPAILGLLALSTAIVPGGFKRGSIVAVVTVGCLLLAGVALRRRWARDRVLAGDEEEDVTQTA